MAVLLAKQYVVVTLKIIRRKPKVVDIYRLILKARNDNFRACSIQVIMNRIKAQCIEVINYEPMQEQGQGQEQFFNSMVVNNLQEFKNINKLTLANRSSPEFPDVEARV